MQTAQEIEQIYAKAHCLFNLTEIETALATMASVITDELQHTRPLVLCVMLGGLIAAGNLLPRLNFLLEVDYIHATRYGAAQTGGELTWLVKPTVNLQNRIILIVDDILDGGLTLTALVDYCHAQGAQAVHTAVLLDKQTTRVAGGLAKADFTGLTMDSGFVFGYGMDYAGYLRNAPGIYIVAE